MSETLKSLSKIRQKAAPQLIDLKVWTTSAFYRAPPQQNYTKLEIGKEIGKHFENNEKKNWFKPNKNHSVDFYFVFKCALPIDLITDAEKKADERAIKTFSN